MCSGVVSARSSVFLLLLLAGLQWRPGCRQTEDAVVCVSSHTFLARGPPAPERLPWLLHETTSELVGYAAALHTWALRQLSTETGARKHTLFVASSGEMLSNVPTSSQTLIPKLELLVECCVACRLAPF